MADMKMVSSALNYVSKGLKVIPLAQGQKIPPKDFSWARYQSEPVTKQDVVRWWKQFPEANIGIVTGHKTCVLDLDKYKEEFNRELILPYLSGIKTPTAMSPRGGLHYYFQTPEEQVSGKVGLFPAVDFRGVGNYIVAPPSINGTGNPYRWLDGLSLEDVSLACLPKELLNIIINNNKYSKGSVDTNNADVYNRLQSSTNVYKQGTRDDSLFHVANSMMKGGSTPEMIYNTLVLLANSCEPPYPVADIKTKIMSALQRGERKIGSLAAEVREWVLSTNGNFLSTDIVNCLQLSTRDDRKNLSIILKRLVTEGLIEKYGNRAGNFKTVNKDADEIDFFNADMSPIEMAYPMDVHTLCHTFPKNIVVVAGEPDSGKTAFLLETVRLNMNKHRINYFSSEMGAQEMKNRIVKFGLPLRDWKFKPRERSSDFADVIEPNEVNIIDFLELHTDFFMVGAHIKAIFDKLDKGVAIIALQKNRDKREGLGGQRSAEKARLYLSMSPNKIEVVKAKGWVDDSVNPNGMKREFKLVQGCRFLPTTNWYK